MKHVFFLFLAFTVLNISAQYQVGHMSLNFKDASRTGGYSISGGIQMPGPGRDIGTEVYYPAVTSGNNVAVATGTFPIVIIGHGFSMDWSSYDNMYNRLASLGYIVALPRTEGSLSPTHADFGSDLRLLGSLLQALNTSTVAGTTTFNNKVNSKVALGGHSMGAGCSYLAAANNTTITCLFNCAAATTNPSSISSASLVTVPTLLLSGQRDCVADTTVQNSHYTALASTKKFHAIIKDMTHCDFGNGTNFNCTFGQGTSGCSNTISNILAFNRYMTYLEPFLANLLKDNCSEGIRFMDSLQSPSSLRVGRKITGTIASPLTISIAGAGAAICSGSQATLTASGANTYTWTGGITNGTAFTPASTQNYSVTATNSMGCSKTVTAGITVNSNPTVTAVSSTSVLCSGVSSATLVASGALTYTWNPGPVSSSNVVTPAVTTIYTVTGSNSSGCFNTTVITQSVSTAVINISITGTSSVCAGNQATLTATGANTYNWTGGITNGTPFTPASSQNYSVTATNSIGCSKTITTSITVNPKPTVTAVSSSPLVCAGSSATLTATGALSYTWTAGATNATYIITPANNTVYSVTGIDANGCYNTAAITQSVSVCAGVQVIKTDDYFSIYPNPTRGNLMVSYNAVTNDPINFELFDLTGKLIYSSTAIPDRLNMNKELNIHDLDSGMYLFTISQNKYRSSCKIIKE